MLNLPFKSDLNYTNIQELSAKEFGIRKKIGLYVVRDEENSSSILFSLMGKSRVLKKDALKIEEIYTLLKKEYIKEQDFSKLIYIEAPLCSKAKLELETMNWKVI